MATTIFLSPLNGSRACAVNMLSQEYDVPHLPQGPDGHPLVHLLQVLHDRPGSACRRRSTTLRGRSSSANRLAEPRGCASSEAGDRGGAGPG